MTSSSSSRGQSTAYSQPRSYRLTVYHKDWLSMQTKCRPVCVGSLNSRPDIALGGSKQANRVPREPQKYERSRMVKLEDQDLVLLLISRKKIHQRLDVVPNQHVPRSGVPLRPPLPLKITPNIMHDTSSICFNLLH